MDIPVLFSFIPSSHLEGREGFPILFLFIFAYFIQYIFSTYLIYNVYDELMFYMEIGQGQYFGYAIPAYLAIICGVLLFNKDIDIRGSVKRINPEQAAKLGYLLLGISYFFDFVQVSRAVFIY